LHSEYAENPSSAIRYCPVVTASVPLLWLIQSVGLNQLEGLPTANLSPNACGEKVVCFETILHGDG